MEVVHQLPPPSQASRSTKYLGNCYSTSSPPCLVTAQHCQLACLPSTHAFFTLARVRGHGQGHPSQIDAQKLAQKGTLVKLRAAPLAVPPTGKGTDAQPRPKISSRNARHGESLSEGGIDFSSRTHRMAYPRGHSSDHRPLLSPLVPALSWESHAVGMSCHQVLFTTAFYVSDCAVASLNPA